MRSSYLIILCAALSPSTGYAAVSTQGGHSADASCIVDEVRRKYSESRKNIIAATFEALNSSDNLDDKVDFEEKGCISSYGLDGSFSIAGLAEGFLSGLKDQVCEAADNYLAGQLDGVTAGMNAPLDLANVDGAIVRDGEGINVDQEENSVSIDTGQIIKDQMDRLPTVDSGYLDYDAGGSLDDFEYIDQKRSGSRR